MTVYSRPSDPYIASMHKSMAEKHHRERDAMWKALREYEALARLGKRYPTHRLEVLFAELKRRFGWAYSHRWSEIDGDDQEFGPIITSLWEEFQNASTRTEKVIAIDHLMHEQHYNGMVLTALYDSSPDIYQLEDNADVHQFLERLFMQKNPIPYASKLKQEVKKCKDAGLKIRPAKKGELKDYAGMNDKAAKAMGHPLPAKTIIWDDKLPVKDQYQTVKHELHERRDMSHGMKYWPAHGRALEAENPILGPVYHGTQAYLEDATQLHKGKDTGIHFGTEAQAWGRVRNRPGADVIPAFVEISNMKREQDEGGSWRIKIRVAKEQGYDGIVYLNRYEGLFAHTKEEFIARLASTGFNPNRIARMEAAITRPRYFNSVSDERFKEIFPEAADSYIVFDSAQIRRANEAEMWHRADPLPTAVRA